MLEALSTKNPLKSMHISALKSEGASWFLHVSILFLELQPKLGFRRQI